MGLAATGLRPAVEALGQFYYKETIDPRIPLEQFKESQLPSFQSGWHFKKAPMLDDIETEEYIFTHFIKQDSYKSPSLAANLFVTYYSNPKDKVAHSPDVCYRQAGAIVKKMTPIALEISLEEDPSLKVPAKLIIFEMPSGKQQVVVFTYCVEGIPADKRWKVRWQIAKPGNRFTYFSKIESTVAFTGEEELNDAVDLCKLLLSEAIAALIADYFPSKEEIRRQ
jgi:hypothetical protein